MRAGEDSGLDEPELAKTQPIRPFTLLGSLSPLLVIPVAIVIGVALFALADVLERWRWARVFTDWLVRNAPFMRGHADSTTYPQLALLVNSLTVVVLPCLAMVWMVQSAANYPKLLARAQARRLVNAGRHLLIIFVGPSLVLIILYVWWPCPEIPPGQGGSRPPIAGDWPFLAHAYFTRAGWCSAAGPP